VEISPVTLEGQHVRLEPLSVAHEEALIAAAGNGELWNSTVTIVPTRATMAAYIEAALEGQAKGTELPFVIIRKMSGEAAESGALARASARAPDTRDPFDKGEVVGTTRFYEIVPADRRVAIGYTWLSKSAQRSAVNTESKLLLLTHAFEHWRCVRVELITDLLNQQSRAAILRLGAKEEGTLRSHMIMPNGRIRDSVVFSIIREEWPEVKARLANKVRGADDSVKPGAQAPG
jgi:RimJ/RimL family protein N-acetyltransferase